MANFPLKLTKIGEYLLEFLNFTLIFKNFLKTFLCPGVPPTPYQAIPFQGLAWWTSIPPEKIPKVANKTLYLLREIVIFK